MEKISIFNFPFLQKVWDDCFFLLEKMRYNDYDLNMLDQELLQWGKDYRYCKNVYKYNFHY